MNAGPAARRSASSGGAEDDHIDESGRTRTTRPVGNSGLPLGAPTTRRRRWFRPSSTTLFLGASGLLAAVFDGATIVRRARRGPWRAEVAEGSMMPALLPGDWLLLDPTCRRWPRPGTIVVIREPGTGILAVKRVAARGRRGTVGRGTVGQGTVAPSVDGPAAVWERPGATAAGPEPSDGGPRSRLGSREAWLLGDAADGSIDSRAYGALDADALVARAWFRYGPLSRFGRLR